MMNSAPPNSGTMRFRVQLRFLAAEIVVHAGNGLSVFHIEIIADAGRAVIAFLRHGHHGRFKEALMKLHIRVEEEQVFALRLQRADEAAKARGRVGMLKHIAARAPALCNRGGVVLRAGVDIDDFVQHDAHGVLDALHAAADARCFVLSDDNDADHPSSLRRFPVI